jgi:uncharacterized protein
MQNTVRILSIDGGGIRGIIPAVVLSRLERQTGQRVADLFDLVAGTSTGGILALGLTRPGTGGRPLYSAAEMSELYEREGSKIFSASFWRRMRTMGSLREERYSADGIEEVLRRYFEDTRLKDACTGVLVPSYEIERRKPFFFKSASARERPEYDFPMWQVARATSAAPTYFEPARLPVPNSSDYWALIDGGVFANNPGACALVEAIARNPWATKFLVVSLGTGNLLQRIPIDEAKGWGTAGWLRPVLDIVLDGVSATVDYQLQQLLPGDYHRFQVTLHQNDQEMDDVRPENLRNLRLQAEAMCRERSRELRKLGERLVAIGAAHKQRAA